MSSVSRSSLLLLVIGVSACGGRQTSSKNAEHAERELDCGPECGPMDACVRGVCRKNPFWQGRAEQPAEEIAAAMCPYAADAIPPASEVPDAKVPEYDAGGTRVVDLNATEVRLSDQVLDAHLETIHPRLMECIDIGACYSESPLFGGRFDFQLRLAGSGIVTEASVTTSPHLKLPAVIACARRSVSEVRFPAFQGTMTVTYSVVIE